MALNPHLSMVIILTQIRASLREVILTQRRENRENESTAPGDFFLFFPRYHQYL
ncbi:MAG: hypothetical protein AAGF28_04615 [Pseudomonadota bacterium]